MVKWMTIVFGSIPIIGWLLSLPWNYRGFGTPFTGQGEWNNLPLWLVTLPCLPVADWIFDANIQWLQGHRYVCVILYTLVCTILYGLVGLVLGCVIRGWMTRDQG
jgi:hypothetical protein